MVVSDAEVKPKVERAEKLAGRPSVSAIAQEDAPDSVASLAIQLLNNAPRKRIKPVELARLYKRIMDLRGWTETRLGEELAVAQASVSRALKLLELPEAVQSQVDQGALSPGAAYEISKLDRPEDQVAVAGHVVAKRLRRDEVRSLVREQIGSRRGKPPRRADFRARGMIVTVIGPEAADPEAVVAALREVLVRL
jgi:ParB family chromosome partitioning protein